MPNGDLQVDFRDQDVADTVRVLRVPAALFADVLNRCAASELKCLSLASVVYNYLGSLRTSDKSNPSDPRLVLSRYMASHRTVFRFCCCHPSCALRQLLLSTCMRYISSSRILAPVANILLPDSIHMPPHFFFYMDTLHTRHRENPFRTYIHMHLPQYLPICTHSFVPTTYTTRLHCNSSTKRCMNNQYLFPLPHPFFIMLPCDVVTPIVCLDRSWRLYLASSVTTTPLFCPLHDGPQCQCLFPFPLTTSASRCLWLLFKVFWERGFFLGNTISINTTPTH